MALQLFQIGDTQFWVLADNTRRIEDLERDCERRISNNNRHGGCSKHPCYVGCSIIIYILRRVQMATLQ